MTVQIIVDNILNEDSFYSATEQAGARIGRPQANIANNGGLIIRASGDASGDIQKFYYDGTTSSDGSTTTLIDTIFTIFGDTFLSQIQATITITESGHAAEGEEKTITNNVQSTGTLTFAAFSGAILTGTDYRLTISYETLDGLIELVAAGDPGEATFKLSFDGGDNLLGRDAPTQANWLGKQVVKTSVDGQFVESLKTEDGSVLVGYAAESDDTNNYIIKSSDKTMSWGDPNGTHFDDFAEAIKAIVQLRTGRIIMYSNYSYLKYSDTNGVSWSAAFKYSPAVAYHSIIQLQDGRIMGAYVDSTNIYIKTSTDGLNFSGTTLVYSASNTQTRPALCQAKDGSIICVFETDETSTGDYEIKACKTVNGGTTWGAVIDVLDFDTVDILRPTIAKDINGDIYVAAYENTTDNRIIFSYSTNNGDSFTTQQVLTSQTGKDLQYPSLCLIDGMQLVCFYKNDTDTQLESVRRGILETYSSNAIPVAIESIKQHFFGDIGISWANAMGSIGDKWSIKPEYDYAAYKIVDSESSIDDEWRSEQDNIEVNLVFRVPEDRRHQVYGAAVFNSNVNLYIESDASVTFATDSGNPELTELIDFTLGTGELSANSSGNSFPDDSGLLANYVYDELAGKIMRLTSGEYSGYANRIIGNDSTYVFLEYSTELANNDDYTLYDTKKAKVFTTGYVREWIRVRIPAQKTPEGVYIIGKVIIGPVINLSKEFSREYEMNVLDNINWRETSDKSIKGVKVCEPKNEFNLVFKNSSTTDKQLRSLMNRIGEKSFAFIPNIPSSNYFNVYNVKKVGDVKRKQIYQDVFEVSLTLREE